MKDFGLDKAMVEQRDSSKRDQRGWGKGFFGFRKMFWDYLNKLNVPFYDACCADAPTSPSPVRDNDGVLESFNGTTWEPVDLGTFSATDIALDDGLVSDLAVKIGADGNNGVYGISDTQLGFAVEGVLVGGANTTGLFTDVIAEQTAATGVTIDGTVVKDGGITTTSTSTADIAGLFLLSGTPQTLTGAGAVNLITKVTLLVTTGANALTLAAGTAGQIKIITMKTNGGDGTLTPAGLRGGTTLTFNAVGDTVTLLAIDSAWVILGNSGVALA